MKRSIKGFGGERVWNVFKGTIIWKWHDNEGQLHWFSIPNSYYVPHGKCHLLSPQHWAQTQLRGRVTPMKKLSENTKDGIGESTLYNCCQKLNPLKAKQTTPEPRHTTFDLDGKTTNGERPPVVIDEEEEKQATTPAQELLRYHHRMAHISVAKLQNMAKQGIIPRRLASVHPPTCSSCLFAKATRQQSRHKHWTEKTVVKTPGQVVSVDQLISPTPGLVAQMTGILTKKRYTCATIYVDQCSGLGFVYLQKSTSADETIMGKTAFEAYAKQHGATIKAYHADNGVFCANKWVDECRRLEQTLTFAGVNAHHSNGLAEQRIRSLQDLAR